VSKVDLRLQCGMPCSKLEVSTVQHGTLSGTGYLHQSRATKVAVLAANLNWRALLKAQRGVHSRRSNRNGRTGPSWIDGASG